MQVVIRADASTAIGMGHLVRCMTLAAALRDRGASVAFVTREHHGHQTSMLDEHGFDVTRLPASSIVDQGGSPSEASLGVVWEVDAEETLRSIRQLRNVHWLIVDHYGIDHRWESRVRTAAQRVFVIDDQANRMHDCDLLLDQNLVAGMRTRYDSLVPKSCALMLGPTYAMLQPDYRELHRQASPRSGPIRRILISFGGSDEANLTGRALAAFLLLGRSDIHADVVIGAANPWEAALREQSAAHRNVTIHMSPPTLAPLMLHADLAIGAAGTTSWERLCLGLPSLVVTQAENQRPIAEALSQNDLARWLGATRDLSESTLVAALEDLLESGLSVDWSRRCLDVVDGRGVDRVAAALSTDGQTVLRVRAARASDEALLLEWANDRVTRANAFASAPIGAAEHHAWFAGRLQDSVNCRIYIGETADAIPVGYVRFDRMIDGWRISYALAPQFRGRGMGGVLLNGGITELAQTESEETLIAEVKRSNSASQRVFESLGFTTEHGGDVIAYRRRVTTT